MSREQQNPSWSSISRVCWHGCGTILLVGLFIDLAGCAGGYRVGAGVTYDVYSGEVGARVSVSGNFGLGELSSSTNFFYDVAIDIAGGCEGSKPAGVLDWLFGLDMMGVGDRVAGRLSLRSGMGYRPLMDDEVAVYMYSAAALGAVVQTKTYESRSIVGGDFAVLWYPVDNGVDLYLGVTFEQLFQVITSSELFEFDDD